jgi:hypothetical protein
MFSDMNDTLAPREAEVFTVQRPAPGDRERGCSPNRRRFPAPELPRADYGPSLHTEEASCEARPYKIVLKGTRPPQVPIPKGQQLRPLAALDAWIQDRDFDGLGLPLATRPIRYGLHISAAATWVRIVKASLEEAGCDPGEYSGHSLRSG